MAEEFLYDLVPYPSHVFSQTFPDRLAVAAKLFGMEPKAAEKCRVLELGCGDGGNLIAQAANLPESRFVGIDLSEVHIDEALKSAMELGLKNIEFHQLDVMEISSERFGEFDYIIAHGLFSWVPDFVREKVLDIYAGMLSKNGVGYISYNVKPGFYLRQIAREMMLYHTKDIAGASEKVEQGKEILGFIGGAGAKDSIYSQIINAELSKMQDRSESNIFHDDFAEINHAYYFSDFIAEADSHELQYLAESEFFSMQAANLAPQTREKLASFGDDLIKREQYLDFIKCRRFRQTLICRKDLKLEREFLPEKLSEFLISSSNSPESPQIDLKQGAIEKFKGSGNASFEINDPLTKAALFLLSENYPRPVAFESLVKESIKLLEKEGCQIADLDQAREITLNIFSRLHSADLIKLHLYAPRFCSEVSDYPKVNDLARWQAKRGNTITTLAGLNLEMSNALIRELIIHADGRRNIEEINQAVSLKMKDIPQNDLPEIINSNLRDFAKNALFIS